MIPVLTAAEMRAADRRTIEEVGLPGAVLMENAGAAVADAVRGRYGTAAVLVLAGRGNNGGDGFVVARRLGPAARVLLFGSAEGVKGDARIHLEALRRSGGRVEELVEPGAWGGHPARAEVAVTVDALLGTGLSRAPEGAVAEPVADLAVGRPGPVVAVDLPSGVPSDAGELEWTAARADLTVTFGAPKRGHVLPPACDRVGELVVADIGIPRALLDSRFGLIEPADVRAAFPPRLASAHKGRFGHLLVVAGSVGKSGAAVLAARAALRCGAGLVTVATPAAALASVAAGGAEIMTEPHPEEGDGGLGSAALGRVLELAETRDAVALGPGLGQAASTRGFVRELASACDRPLLIDADGLNAVAASEEGPGLLEGRRAPTVLTPHPGEMGRLLGGSSSEVQARRLESVLEAARASGAVVVLKGQRTLVAEPTGRAAVNPTGNPGMATAGTGDVLSGAVAALLARECDPWVAACAGVYLHGAAGDRVAAEEGPEGVLAGGLADALPRALEALRTGGA